MSPAYWYPAEADLGSHRLCVWAAPGSDVAGVDSGLRAVRAADAWGSMGEALAGQRADSGPVVRAVAGSRDGTLADAARDIVTAADPHSRERVGRKQSRVAGGRYRGAVRRKRGWGICVDDRWGRSRDHVGGVAGDVGTRPGGDIGGVAGYGSLSALFAAGPGQ